MLLEDTTTLKLQIPIFAAGGHTGDNGPSPLVQRLTSSPVGIDPDAASSRGGNEVDWTLRSQPMTVTGIRLVVVQFVHSSPGSKC